MDRSLAKENNEMKRRIGTIHISNIPFEATVTQLQHVFDKAGDIEWLRIVRDHDGVSMGYGFCKYRHAKSARDAVEHGISFVLSEQEMIVSYAKFDKDFRCPIGALLHNSFGRWKNTVGFQKENEKITLQYPLPLSLNASCTDAYKREDQQRQQNPEAAGRSPVFAESPDKNQCEIDCAAASSHQASIVPLHPTVSSLVQILELSEEELVSLPEDEMVNCLEIRQLLGRNRKE